MKKLLILLIITINCYSQDDIQKLILDEINKARLDPCKYGVTKTKDNFLCNIKSSKPLKFNEAISKGCFKWANHMYQTDNFEHDYNDRLHNESIYWGNIYKCIIKLIIDEPGEDNLSNDYGHRKHLLAMEYPSTDDTQIGIGYIKDRGNKYVIVIRTR